jgi:hypothetical protein
MKFLCVYPDVYDKDAVTVYLEQGREYTEAELPYEGERNRLLGSGRLLEVAEVALEEKPLEETPPQPDKKKGGR